MDSLFLPSSLPDSLGATSGLGRPFRPHGKAGWRRRWRQSGTGAWAPLPARRSLSCEPETGDPRLPLGCGEQVAGGSLSPAARTPRLSRHSPGPERGLHAGHSSSPRLWQLTKTALQREGGQTGTVSLLRRVESRVCLPMATRWQKARRAAGPRTGRGTGPAFPGRGRDPPRLAVALRVCQGTSVGEDRVSCEATLLSQCR